MEIRIKEKDLSNMIKEAVKKTVKESTDRHREGYWKERWAKQNAEKLKDNPADAEANKKPAQKKKDRHKLGYYRKYNMAHPERLNRGFTKGYKNGNLDDGLAIKPDKKIWLDPDTYIIGYDEIGRPITNHPLSDLLRNKDTEWHDDDWDEGSWDD